MSIGLADLHARVETDLDNNTLQRIIDSAVKAIDRAAGKVDSETETFLAGGATKLHMSRRVLTITSIDERRSLSGDPVTLDASDYRMIGAYRLFRMTGGTNPSGTWGAQVDVIYVPEIDVQVRDRVTLDLCQMDVEFRALDEEKVGDFEGKQKDYKTRRRELLRQVREGRSWVVA